MSLARTIINLEADDVAIIDINWLISDWLSGELNSQPELDGRLNVFLSFFLSSSSHVKRCVFFSFHLQILQM